MKLHHDQLTTHLQRNLAALYLIAGEEILFQQEAQDAIRAAAFKGGFTETLRFHADTGFDWFEFQKASQNASLFSDKQCLELTLVAGKISDAGKKVLQAYLEKPPAGKLLILRTGKLDAATQKTAWYKAADKLGIVIPIWPLTAAQFPAWIQQRLKTTGLQADAAAVQLLTVRTEGNLLAAAQEIEKLSLLYPNGRVTAEEVASASSNNARYNVFTIIDVILPGKPLVVVRVLKGLQAEAAEPTLVLWALAREARQWLQWLQAMQAGQTLAQLLASNYMLVKKQALIARALERQTVNTLYSAIQKAANVDAIIKGAATGKVWDELETLALMLTGVKTIPMG